MLAMALVVMRHVAKLVGVVSLGSFSGLSLRQCMALGWRWRRCRGWPIF
jgi:hypothetical protein